MKKYTIYVLALVGLCATLATTSCREDELSPQSVVEQYLPPSERSDLDRWIERAFAPYNIYVQYRWQKQNLPVGSVAIPPRPEQVQSVLEAVRDLCFALYEQPKAGGVGFVRNKQILRLTLLGGSEMQPNGVLLRLWYPDVATNELFVYDVNNFSPRDKSSVYRLMRSVHHQFAKRLTEQYPYDRDAFSSISPQSYGSLALAPSVADAPRRVGLSAYAHRRGFYTLHSMASPEDEFAEIVSISLLHGAVELDAAEQTALRPIDAESASERGQAQEAYRVMRAKRAFVENYFRTQLGISLSRLQILSLRQLNTYYTEHHTQQ